LGHYGTIEALVVVLAILELSWAILVPSRAVSGLILGLILGHLRVILG
jgi:hypothetical protein